MKPLLLFDIDGTLVRGGNGKDSFRHALELEFGTAGPIEHWDFSGKTDPQIARELLREAGLEDPEIDPRLPRIWDGYLTGLEAELQARPMTVLPGVMPLLEALVPLEAEGRVALGIVTGNLARGAELKLASIGVAHHFSVGGYGSDHENRIALPPVAVQRAHARWNHPFEARQVIVIGDTPRDVACGRENGMRTVAVATGRFDRPTLEATGADWVLDTLANTAEVVDLLLTG
jgi:phosphoglycolate phosphatase